MTENLADNPLMNMGLTPAFDKIEVAHIEPAMTGLIEEGNALIDQLEAEKPTTWETLIDKMEIATEPIWRAWGAVSHLMSVKNSDELREVYQKIQPAIVELSNRFGQSKALYEGFVAIRDNEWDNLCQAQQRIISSSIKSAELAGVALEGAEKERFQEIQKQLAELSTTFSNNVLDSTKDFKMLLTEKSDVEGLPESLLNMSAHAATQDGHEGATAEAGPWLITLDYPSFGPFLQHSKRRELREKVYRAYISRASKGQWDNCGNIEKILELRKEKSALLGYENFAEVSLATKMAPNVEAVESLLTDLRGRCVEAGKKDRLDLIDLAAENNAPEAENFMQWDSAFWSERLREARYDINQEQLRPYFALPNVLNGMFNLAEKLFQIEVKPADGKVPVWHEDVQYFEVFDKQTGKEIAGFYLDAYSRPAEKRAGAWMNVCVSRSKLLAPEGQEVRLPIAYVVCNQTPPVGDKPSLMTFNEVNTMFHEFGHALQHMLTEVDYSDAAGVSNVEWDAVELPSQFMENFCTHKPTLLGLAKHYQTGETLPEEIADRLIEARTFLAGSGFLRQIYFGLTDMELHTRYNPGSGETAHDVQMRIGKQTLTSKPLDDDYFLCGFGHIFAGGYCAGYYSYKWAEVLSADAFEAFEEAGLDDEKAIAETGMRFRKTVLALGGSKHPTDVFVEFRGREPKVDALLKHNNLA